MTDTDFNTALQTFLTTMQGEINANFAKNYPNLDADLLSVDKGGRKFIRIVKTSDGGRGQRSVFCFVEKATGNVLKAASWKAPAKHARGTIFTNNVRNYGVTAYGANYLR